jgi:hypothetical protein
MSPAAPPPLPQAPAAPPNPPMFGSQATGAGQRQRSMAGASQGFGSTILGQGNPTNVGNKTLLGQ